MVDLSVDGICRTSLDPPTVRGTGANTPGGRGYHPAEVLRTLRASRSPRWSGCWVGCRCFRRLAWDAQYGLRPFGHPPVGVVLGVTAPEVTVHARRGMPS